MATYYPSCQAQAEYCELCNTAQDPGSACTSTSSSNSSENKSACSVYCDSGCNSECDEAQTICVVHSQYIKDHADVGAYNGSTVTAEDFIHEKWTADYWNTLIQKINTAEGIGKNSSHGSAGSVSAAIGNNALYTQSLYNQVNTKLCNFNTSYNQVNVDDLITVSIANAIGTAYNAATFNSSVCDMCDSDQTMRGGCGCNCSCSCSCNCGCSCPCSCNCGCNCSCDCGPSCPCSNNTPSSKT